MARLIDADKLEKQLDNEKWMDNYDRDFIVGVALDEAPTVDAVPVVHGKWVQKKTAIGKTYSVCSRCETDFKFQTDKGTLARLDMDGMNFCPNCGAKMDGERRNNDA